MVTAFTYSNNSLYNPSRSGLIQSCNSRLANCNITKITGFSNGMVTNNRKTQALRMSTLIHIQTRLRNGTWKRQYVPVNDYGQRSGGPNGYGQSPKNTF